MTRRRESKPAPVPFAATPAGEPSPIRDWANPSVWTDRMLTALETGVRGGRWHTLSDKVFSPLNLFTASERVVANGGAAGVDHQSVEDFLARRPEELRRLEESLRNETYRPQAVRRTWIPKPGSTEKRPLGIPTVRDRVVQTALLHVLEPIFDATFARHSYGFRHGRGCHHALERVESLLKEGCVYVVDADLKSYFDTIPHDRLLDRVREKVSDSRVLRMIQMFLEQGVMDGLSQWVPEEGTPQGAVISPLLANIYLNPLDHLLEDAGFATARYADDFVILCRSREEAERALALVETWVAENGLTLHPTKTRIVDARTEGFDFLGYHFRGALRLPRDKSLKKLKDTVRAKTRRTHGHSMEFTCASLSATLRGWFTYFRHCHGTVFRDLDGWIRMRLRSILRKRSGRPGRGRGADHQRWPNSYFAERALFSLEQAHVRFRQSSPR
ncbi:MAG: group II intron reverse transcriptase/maturase [bacterium]|nr:group II intron reverse transcriptase/maturase [bacterium]